MLIIWIFGKSKTVVIQPLTINFGECSQNGLPGNTDETKHCTCVAAVEETEFSSGAAEDPSCTEAAARWICRGSSFFPLVWWWTAVAQWLDYGRHVMSSSPVPLNARRVGKRCTLYLSRAEMSSHWCCVVVKRGGASSGVVHVT
ncbi:hypothetical protein TNCV_1786131 [Trichonephila clavipes]|nr:hypothetical protein TNCV_1786131 [Trichonephila clavipes]